MARRLTYAAIAFGGACGALAALIGSPSASTETSAPFEGRHELPPIPSTTLVARATGTSTNSSGGAPTTAASAAPAMSVVAPAALASAPLQSFETQAPPDTPALLLRDEMHCDQKEPPSCILAARAYEAGSAGVTDAAKAVNYRKIALTLWISQCEHHSATACVTLASMYRTGRGVPTNEKTASALIVRARELCRYNEVPVCRSLPPQ